MCFRPPSADKKSIKCPICGADNPPSATKCIKCGAEASDLPPGQGIPGPAARPTFSGAVGITPPKTPPVPPKAPSVPEGPDEEK